LSGLNEWSLDSFIELVSFYGENFKLKDLFAKKLRMQVPNRLELLVNQFLGFYHSANTKGNKKYNAIQEMIKQQQRKKSLKKYNKIFIERLKNGNKES